MPEILPQAELSRHLNTNTGGAGTGGIGTGTNNSSPSRSRTSTRSSSPAPSTSTSVPHAAALMMGSSSSPHQGLLGGYSSSSPLHTGASTPNSPMGPLPSSPLPPSTFSTVNSPNPYPSSPRHMHSHSQSTPTSSSPVFQNPIIGPTPRGGPGAAGAGLSPPPPQHYLRDMSKTPDTEESIKRLKKKSELYERNRKSIKQHKHQPHPSPHQHPYHPHHPQSSSSSSLNSAPTSALTMHVNQSYELRPTSPSTLNETNETMTPSRTTREHSYYNTAGTSNSAAFTTEFSALSETKVTPSPKGDVSALPSAHQIQLLHLQDQQSNGKRWSFLDKDPMGKKPSSSSSRANSISEREAALFNARRSLEDGALIPSNPAANPSYNPASSGVRRHSEPSAEFMMGDSTRSPSSSRRGSFRTANSGGSMSGRLHQSHRAKGSESSLSLSSNTSSSAFPPSLDLGHGLTQSPPLETPHFSLYSSSLKPLTPTIISNDCPVHSASSPNPNGAPVSDGVCTCETQAGSRWPRSQNSLEQSPSTSTHSHNAPSITENQPNTPNGNMNANNPVALFDVQKRRRAQAFDQFTSYTAALPFHRPQPSRQTSANSSGGSGGGSAEGVEISMSTGRVLSGPASASVFTPNELSRHVQQQSLSLSGSAVNPLGGGMMRPLHTSNSTPDFHSSSTFDMKSWRQQRKEEEEEDFGTVLTPVGEPEAGKSAWRVSGLFSGLQRTQSGSHLRRRSDQFDPHLPPNMRQEIPQSKKSSWRKMFYLRALFPAQPNSRNSPPPRRGEGPIMAEVTQTTVYSIQSAAAQQQQPPPSAFSTSTFAYATPPAARLSTSSELVYPQSYPYYR
ncbi:hypothetical protein CPB86DRAFT_16939 [Serendipita vermifera]|nr:hypothetical protein CPB86DRAFT_16939 [Serendipita vermifera]